MRAFLVFISLAQTQSWHSTCKPQGEMVNDLRTMDSWSWHSQYGSVRRTSDLIDLSYPTDPIYLNDLASKRGKQVTK